MRFARTTRRSASSLVALALLASASFAVAALPDAPLLPAKTKSVIRIRWNELKALPGARQVIGSTSGGYGAQVLSMAAGFGIDSDKEIDGILLLSTRKDMAPTAGFLSGSFQRKAVESRIKARSKGSSKTIGGSTAYEVGKDYWVAFATDSSLAFGAESSLYLALSAFNGKTDRLPATSPLPELLKNAAPLVAVGDFRESPGLLTYWTSGVTLPDPQHGIATFSKASEQKSSLALALTYPSAEEANKTRMALNGFRMLAVLNNKTPASVQELATKADVSVAGNDAKASVFVDDATVSDLLSLLGFNAKAD